MTTSASETAGSNEPETDTESPSEISSDLVNSELRALTTLGYNALKQLSSMTNVPELTKNPDIGWWVHLS